MTGVELSSYLCLSCDFCEWHCGKYVHEGNYLCIECKYQLAYDMYIIALDMLETA